MNFAKAFTITFFAQTVIVLSGLINNLIVVRYLGPEGQGIYTLILTTSVMLLIFGGAGLVTSNTFFVKRKKEEASTLFINSLFFALFISLLAFIFYITFGKTLLLGFFTADLSIVLMISLPLILIQEFNQGILWGLERYDYYNLITIIKAICLVLANLVIVLVLKLGIKAVVLGWLLTIALTSFISTFILCLEIGVSNIFPKLSTLIESLTLGFKALICDIIWFFSTRMDLYLIAFLLGAKDVGFYSIAILIIQLSTIIPTIFGKFIFTKSAEANENKIYFVSTLIKITAAYSFLFVLIVLITGEAAIRLAFGQTFIKSFYCLILLLPGSFAQNLNINISFFINGSKSMPRHVIFVTALTMALNFMLNISLIPSMGINGAAISSSLSQITQFLLLLLLLKKFKLGLQMNGLFSLKSKDVTGILSKVLKTI